MTTTTQDTTDILEAVEKELTDVKSWKVQDKEDGSQFSMLDILEEAEVIAKGDVKQDGNRKAFDTHICLMAEKAGSVERFRMVTAYGEGVKHWGKAPKGSSPQERTLYKAAPTTYTQYKSRILAAMEAGIVVGGKFDLVTKLKTPHDDGSTHMVEDIPLTSVRNLVKARKQVQAEQEAKANPEGYILNEDGTPDVQSSMFAASIKELHDGFSLLNEAEQAKINKKLTTMIAAMVKVIAKIEPEVIEQEQAAA